MNEYINNFKIPQLSLQQKEKIIHDILIKISHRSITSITPVSRIFKKLCKDCDKSLVPQYEQRKYSEI